MEPTILAMGSAEVICTTGMPAFSSSVVIAAPLRVLVPQVDVRITASTPSRLIFPSHFPSQTACVRQRIGAAAGGEKLLVQFADDAAFFQLTQSIERHQAVGIVLDKPGVVTAVRDFVVFAA